MPNHTSGRYTVDDVLKGRMPNEVCDGGSLMPALLVSGPQKDLPSPISGDDERVITDIGHIIRNRKTLYITVDSLSYARITAIRALVLSSTAAFAGYRYNYESEAHVGKVRSPAHHSAHGRYSGGRPR